MFQYKSSLGNRILKILICHYCNFINKRIWLIYESILIIFFKILRQLLLINNQAKYARHVTPNITIPEIIKSRYHPHSSQH